MAAQAPPQGQPPQQRAHLFQQQQVAVTPGNNSTSISGGRSLADNPGESLDQYEEEVEGDSRDSRNEVQKKVQHPRDDKDHTQKVQQKRFTVKNVRNEANKNLPVAGSAEQTTNQQKTQLSAVANAEQKRNSTSSQVPPLKLDTLNTFQQQNNAVTKIDQNQKKQSIKEEQKKLSTEPKEDQDIEKQKPLDQNDSQNQHDKDQPEEEQVLREQSDKSQIVESELSPQVIKTEYEIDDLSIKQNNQDDGDTEIIIDEAQEQQSQNTQKSKQDDSSAAHKLNEENISKKTISDLEKSATVHTGDFNGQQQENLRKDLTVKAQILAAIAVPDTELLLNASHEEEEQQSDHKSQENIVEEIVALSRQSDEHKEHKDNEEIEQKEFVENLQETQQSVKVLPVSIVHESPGQLQQQEQDYSKQKTIVKQRRSSTDFKVKDSDVDADDLFRPQKTKIINISCSEKIEEDHDVKEVDQIQLKTGSKKATISVNYNNNSDESKNDKSVHNIDQNIVEGPQSNNMAEIIHWMLGKMNDKTILDYKTNPEQVVAQFIKERRDTDAVKSQKTPPLQDQTDSLLDEVEDLPQYYNNTDDKANKSREVLIHLNSVPMEQFREKKSFCGIEEQPMALNKNNQEPAEEQKFDKNYQTPSKKIESNEDNLSSELYNSPYKDLKPVIEVSLLAQRSQSIRCNKDKKQRLEKINDFASGRATRRQSNVQEQSYCQNFGDSPSIDLKIGKSINEEESLAKLTNSSIKSSSRISRTTSHASSKKMSESQSSRKSYSVDRLKPPTFTHQQSPKQSQKSDQIEENDRIDNFAELLNSIGLSNEELQQSDTTGQKQLKKNLLQDTHLQQEDLPKQMIKTQKPPTTIAAMELMLFFGQNVECDDLTHIKIEGYNGQQKQIDSLTQKVLQNCKKVRDRILQNKSNSDKNVDFNHLAQPKLSPLKQKAKSTRLLSFTLHNARIFSPSQTPQNDNRAGEFTNDEDVKYEDLFKIDEISQQDAGERRASTKVGGRLTDLKAVREGQSIDQVQQRISPLPGLTKMPSDKKRNIFSRNKDKHQTQENVLTIQNKLNFKLGHSQTFMTKKSMKSDSSPLKAYEMAQKIKQERLEAEQEKQRFKNILEAKQSFEEKLYMKWIQPKRKIQIESRRRRYSGRRGGIMSTPGSLTNLLVLSMKDSSTSIPNSSMSKQLSNNLSTLWVPHHLNQHTAAGRFQRPEISEFVDQVLESMETNWNNFIHKQQMENCYFFNYDKLYSIEDDFDLNEQRLGEFDEEEKHKWGLNFEIKLVEINDKISVAEFEGLSPMKEEEENTSKDGSDDAESYDLSELSDRNDILDISPNKELPHYISKRVFQDRHIELIQRGQFSLNEQMIMKKTLYQKILAKVDSDTVMLKKFQDSMMELNHRHYSVRIRRIQKLKQAPVTSTVLNHNVIKKDQLGRYIERPQIQSAPITYYLFYSSTKNNITKKLYKDEYRKTFYDLWLRAFQEFQEIYQEQEIEKKQKARIVKKNNTLENNAGAMAGFLSSRQQTYTGKVDQIYPQQHKTQMLLAQSVKHSSNNLYYGAHLLQFDSSKGGSSTNK